MKECDIYRGGGSKHTLTPPAYFQGDPLQPTGSTAQQNVTKVRHLNPLQDSSSSV